MKNCKTFYETQTAIRLKEIIQPPPLPPQPHQIKFYYVSGTKFSYGEIQKYIDICFQSASRMQFLGVKKHVCWKICKVRMVFGCVAGAYYFQCQES